jgi:uncharacterized damage-inducible protein DinB
VGDVDEVDEVDEHGRRVPPLGGDEAATLLGFLEFQRATIAWKCAGLDAAGLRATVGPSTMSLGGLLKHLAGVEHYWCTWVLHDRDPGPPWNGEGGTDPDWAWRTAADDSPEALHAIWRDAVDSSRAQVAEALANGGLDHRAAVEWGPGHPPPSLRWIVCHLIEEYARHVGHADLLRESVDGQTGE